MPRVVLDPLATTAELSVTNPSASTLNHPTGGGGDPPEPGAASLALSVPENRTTMTSPCCFPVEASLTNADVDDPRKDPVYRWSLGIPGKVFTRLDSDFFWRDQNVAWGYHTLAGYNPSPAEFNGAETLTYTIECECRLRNRSTGTVEAYTASIDVTIRNPDHANHEFAGTNTICISPGGATGEEPAGAQVVSTWAAANSAGAGKKNCRFLFHGGETYDFTSSQNVSPNDSNAPVRRSITTYPHGTTATLRWLSGNSATAVNAQRKFEDAGLEFSIEGLTLIGAYDPTDPYSWENGPMGQGVGVSSANKIKNGIWERDIRYTIMNVEATGFNQGFSWSDQTAHVYLYNARTDGWGDYGWYQGRSWDYIFTRGFHAKQPIGTWTGDGTKEDQKPPPDGHPGYHVANHGPFRHTAPPFRGLLANADLRSLNSWGTDPAIQPAIRASGRHVVHPYQAATGEYAQLMMSCIRAEAGTQMFGFDAGVGNDFPEEAEAHAPCFVVEKVYAIGWGTDRFLGAVAPGLTVRNMIAVWPSMETPNNTWQGAFCAAGIETNDGSFTAEAYANYSMEHYSNSLMDLRTDARAAGKLETGTGPYQFTGQIPYFSIGDPNLYSTIRLHNLVMYGPDWVDEGDADDTFDMSSIWTPHMNGHYLMSTYPTVTYPDVVFQPSDAPACIPGAGSSARGGANTTTEKWAMDDIWGNWRDPENVSRGAVEPNTTS